MNDALQPLLQLYYDQLISPQHFTGLFVQGECFDDFSTDFKLNFTKNSVRWT